MGLDMYLYKVCKLSDEEVKIIDGIDSNRACTIIPSLSYFNISELKEYDDMPLISGVLPYCRKVELSCCYVDIGKIKAVYNVPAPAYVVGYSYSIEFNSYTFKDGDKEYKVNISKDMLREDFTYVKLKEYYVCKMEEVAYWRKEYSVQDYIHEHLDYRVQNCGYYYLDEEFIKELFYDADAACGFDRSKVSEDDFSDIFYHEWY